VTCKRTYYSPLKSNMQGGAKRDDGEAWIDSKDRAERFAFYANEVKFQGSVPSISRTINSRISRMLFPFRARINAAVLNGRFIPVNDYCLITRFDYLIARVVMFIIISTNGESCGEKIKLRKCGKTRNYSLSCILHCGNYRGVFVRRYAEELHLMRLFRETGKILDASRVANIKRVKKIQRDRKTKALVGKFNREFP